MNGNLQTHCIMQPYPKEIIMNTDTVGGKFDQIKGSLKQTWAKLTDDDVMLYNGKRDEFLGKLKEHYGLAKEDAETKIKAIEDAAHKM
jgi:uncharacterized protein YjbJ (UPF0337 family)